MIPNDVHHAYSFDKYAMCGARLKNKYDERIDKMEFSPIYSKVTCHKCREKMAVAYLIEKHEI